jgi:hypothetical protein
MYIRSHDGLRPKELSLAYEALGLSGETGKVNQLSPEVVYKLTDLVFFARYPELKGKEIRGNAGLVAEYNNIKKRLAKPSSSGNSTGFVIDLTLPQVNPRPDYSKTENELGVWEWAIFHGNLSFRFSTEKTDMPNGKPGSFVSMLSVGFDNPRFSVLLAKHLRESSLDRSQSREGRNAWRQTLILIQEHAYVHLKLYRSAAENMQKVLQELLNRLLPLPNAKKPLEVSKEKLDEYLKRLGEFLNAMVTLEFWERTCNWETEDYPKLSRNINRAGAVYLPRGLEVNCGKRPRSPEILLPPVPIKAK